MTEYNMHRSPKPGLRRPVRFTALVLFVGCLTAFRPADDPAYKAETDAWHQRRLNALRSETGWLNLAGLYWLQEGVNTVGSAAGNAVTFPAKAPGSVGEFRLQNGTVSFLPRSGETILLDGKPLTGEVTVFSPDLAKPPVLQQGSLRWFVIKRGPKYGIRLRDLESPILKAFHGIERFPVDETWRVKARLLTPKPGATIAILDVTGQTSQQALAGTLEFVLKGRTYRLDAVTEGEELFILFADATNGKKTYGAGRFLYAAMPGTDGITTLDFNRAYNPPCAFTPYATCPLPPPQNRLTLAVTAGELKAGDH